PPVSAGSPLFPYTTLFRSALGLALAARCSPCPLRLLRRAPTATPQKRQAQARAQKPGRADERPCLFKSRGDRMASWASAPAGAADRKSTRLNSSHDQISYA